MFIEEKLVPDSFTNMARQMESQGGFRKYAGQYVAFDGKELVVANPDEKEFFKEVHAYKAAKSFHCRIFYCQISDEGTIVENLAASGAGK